MRIKIIIIIVKYHRIILYKKNKEAIIKVIKKIFLIKELLNYS